MRRLLVLLALVLGGCLDTFASDCAKACGGRVVKFTTYALCDCGECICGPASDGGR